jgi:hypothetical protein
VEAKELGALPHDHTYRNRRCLPVSSMALIEPPQHFNYILSHYFCGDHHLSDQTEGGYLLFEWIRQNSTIGTVGLESFFELLKPPHAASAPVSAFF